MVSLISIDDLSITSITEIISLSKIYKYKKFRNPPEINKDFVIGLMFFEPSTRTKYSFQTAIHKLGLKFLDYSHNTSSTKKGESLQDTISTFECFCDLLIIRHPNKSIFKNINFTKPVINAGNGDDEHPTQALLDLFTISDVRELTQNLKISFVGDIKYSRTIHSLIKLLEIFNSQYRNIVYTYNFIGYDNLLDNNLEKSVKTYKNIDKNDNINNLLTFKPDIIYATRIQKERSGITRDTDIIIDDQLLNKLPEKTILMHPLPRNNELDISCDSNHRSKYFDQIKNGIFVRMAIIYKILCIDNRLCNNTSREHSNVGYCQNWCL